MVAGLALVAGRDRAHAGCGRSCAASWRSPQQVSLFFRHRRAMKGYLAISRGLIAIGAGDLQAGAPLGRRRGAAVAGRSAGAAARARNRRRWPATAPPPSTPSAPCRRATTPSCSACAGSMSRRSGATIAAARAAPPRRRRRPRRHWPGPGRRCSIIAARPATGPARSTRSSACSPPLDKADYRRKRAVLLTARAQALDDDRPRRRARGDPGSGQARARSGAGGGDGGTAAGGSGRAAQGAQDSGSGLGRQSASRHRRGLCQFAASATRRAIGWRACRSSPACCPASSKARSRWRAPRSMRANLPPRARRLRLTCRRRRGASPR